MDKGIGGPLTSWAFWKSLLSSCARTAIQTAIIAFFSTTLSYLSKALTDVFVPGANAAQTYNAPYQSSSFAQPQAFNAGSANTRPAPAPVHTAQGSEMFFSRAAPQKPTSPAETHFGANSTTHKNMTVVEIVDLYKKDPSNLTLAQQQVAQKYILDKEKEASRALAVTQASRVFPAGQKSQFDIDYEKRQQEAVRMNDDFITMIQVSMENDLFCPPGCMKALEGYDNLTFWEKKHAELPLSFRITSEEYWERTYGTKFKNDRCGMSMKEFNVYLQHNPEPIRITAT